MKRVLTSVAMAIALVGFIGIAGCDNDAGDNDGVDSTAVDTSSIDVDSGLGGSSEVSADEREYEFDGTVKSVSGDMVTVDHEAISDYKPAGTNSYKLASSEMAQYVKKGERMSFKMKMTGDQAVITQVETASDDDDGDSANARGSTARDDMDTVGSNAGQEKPDRDDDTVGSNANKR
jgi:hypothetical protein